MDGATAGQIFSFGIAVPDLKQDPLEKIDKETDEAFQKGAGLIGAAIATYFGGPEASPIGDAIGKAIYRAFAGDPEGPDAEFQHEVIERLDRIERELEEIISFLQNKLPLIARVAADQGHARATNLELIGLRNVGFGLMKTIASSNNPPTDGEFMAAVDATGQAFKTGAKLMRYGQEWHSGVIHAFTTGITMWIALARIRPKFKVMFVDSCLEYAKFANECLAERVNQGYWVDPPPQETIAMAKSRIDRELPWATKVLKRVRRGRVTYLLATNSPTFAEGGWFETVNEGTGFNGNHAFWYPILDQPHPETREELIALVTRPPLNWELPAWKDIYEVRDSPRRDPYAETVAELWTALGMEQRSLAALPTIENAIPALQRMRDAALALSQIK